MATKSEFQLAWWTKFVEQWNGTPVRTSHPSHTILTVGVTGIEHVGLEFFEDGHCALTEPNEAMPSFYGGAEVWRRVLSGGLTVEKAVLAGDINYVGPMGFLTEHWDLLRSVVANGSNLLETVSPTAELIPTDMMVHTEHSAEVVTVLCDQLGMNIETEKGVWTSLLHPRTGQRIVIVSQPLPLGPIAVGCAVKDLEPALTVLARAVPTNQLQVIRGDGYAHVSLYGDLCLLLYSDVLDNN